MHGTSTTLGTVALPRFGGAHRPVPAEGFVGAEAGWHFGHREVFVGNGERGGVGEIGADVGDHLRRATGTGRVHAVREQNDEHLALRIDPHGRAGKAGVSVAVFAEIGTGAMLSFADFPAEGATARGARREELDGGIRDDAIAVVGAAVEEHLRKNREIASRTEEPRVTGDTAKRVSIFVVHLTLERIAAGRGDFGGGNAIDERVVGQEARVGHAERTENAALEKAVHAFARDVLDDHAQDIGAEIGIYEARTRAVFEWRVEDELFGFVGCAGVPPQFAASGETATMHEELAHGDVFFLSAVEARHVVRDFFVEHELAFVKEHHGGGRGADDFRERGEVIDGAVGKDERAVLGPAEAPESLGDHGGALAAHNHGGAWEAACGDPPLNDAVDGGQAFRRHADRLWRLDGKPVRVRRDGSGDEKREEHDWPGNRGDKKERPAGRGESAGGTGL